MWLGEHTGFDALGELDLVGRRQQSRLADAVEVHADEVRRGALRVEVGVGERPTLAGSSICWVGIPRSRIPRASRFESLD